MTEPVASAVSAFIARWQASGAAERANYQLFLSELCDLLGVPRPDPTRPDDRDDAYLFEHSVTFQRARTDKVAELLATLVALGQAREVEGGWFVG